jgi:hypothetical protein
MNGLQEAAKKLGQALNNPSESFKVFQRLPVRFTFWQRLKIKVYAIIKPLWAQRLIIKLIYKVEKIWRS